MLRLIDIMQTYLVAGADMVQAFFCVWNHSIEPGWGHGLNRLWLAALRAASASARQSS